MPILIECSTCHRKLRVNDHLLGKWIKCPNCQAKFPANQIAEIPAAPGTAMDPAEVVDQPAATQSASLSTPPTAAAPKRSWQLQVTPVRIIVAVVAFILLAGTVGYAAGWFVGADIERAAAGAQP
jgi:hypothetical protein